jgi:hypothetical protein
LQPERLPDDRPEPARRRLGQRPRGQQLPICGRKLYVVDPPYGDTFPLGLLRVDLGEHATGRAVRGEPAAGRHREVLATPATPELRVEEQGVRDGYVDHDLPRTGDQVRHLAGDKHLRASESRRLYCLHPHQENFGATRRRGGSGTTIGL